MDLANHPLALERLTLKQQEIRDTFRTHRTTLVAAANRAGKTRAGAYIMAGTAKGMFPEIAKAPCKIMCVALGADTARESIEEYLRYFLPEEDIKESTRREGLTKYRLLHNGSEIVIRTEGQRWRSFQGAQPHVIWFDEEPAERMYTENTMRLRAGHQLRVLFTLTPLLGFTWIYERLVQNARKLGIGIVKASIFENGYPPCELCQEHPGYASAECPRCRGFGITPFFSAEELAERELTLTGAEKAARLHGVWGVIGGHTLFTEADIALVEDGLQDGVRGRDGVVRFETYEPGNLYGIGIDGGYGVGADDTVLSGWNMSTGNQAFEWADNNTPAADVISLVGELAQEYHRPLVCIERQGPGEGLLELAKQNPHIWLYQQRQLDARGFNQTMRLGYWTSYTGRGKLLDHFAGDIRTADMVVRSRYLWKQMSRVVLNTKNGRFEADSGGKDDGVFAAAMAGEARRSRHWQRESLDTPNPVDEYYAEQRRQRRTNRIVKPFPLGD